MKVTHTWSTFLVGLAAAVGAGISMGFAEALSDLELRAAMSMARLWRDQGKRDASP